MRGTSCEGVAAIPFSRPTLSTLRTQAMQDITAGLTGADGLLRRSVLRVLAWVQAGMAYLHYGFIDWASRMGVPFTAEAEFLDAWAALKGVVRKPATFSIGTATFAGAGTIGAGTAVVRSDNVSFTSGGAVTAAGGFATIIITANVAGVTGNFDANTAFTLGVSIAGITSASTASAQTTIGADVETDAELRIRMLQVYAAPPQGGDRVDYIEWATAIAGVTRAWVAPLASGAGTVSVYFMEDDARSAFNGFPQGTNGVATTETRDVVATGDQLTVANAIQPLQPVTALVYAMAPTALPVAFTVADLGTNNTAAMHTAIAAALADLFVREANVGGTINPDTGATWLAMEPDAWYAALEAIPGLSAFKVTVPAAAITPGAGQLFTVGVITFAA